MSFLRLFSWLIILSQEISVSFLTTGHLVLLDVMKEWHLTHRAPMLICLGKAERIGMTLIVRMR